MQHSNPTTTPLENGTQLQKTIEKDEKSDPEHYRQIIGCEEYRGGSALVWITGFVCSALSFRHRGTLFFLSFQLSLSYASVSRQYIKFSYQVSFIIVSL